MKIKSLKNEKSAKAHIEFLKKSGFPFTLKISNYTIEIVSDLYNIQFLHSMRSNRCFAAYAKVKSNVMNFPLPDIDYSRLEYFHHDFNKEFYAPHAINIDLRSAYATVLYNDGYISEDTFRYIQSIPKMDRLAAIGMLASKKYCFEYRDGDLVDYYKIQSELESFFFYCAQRVGDVMRDLKKIAGEDYLFTWVDGIYLRTNDEYLYEISDYLANRYFNWTIDIIYNFRVSINQKGKIRLSFWKEHETKDGFEICKQKIFNIPPASSMLATDIVNYLTNKNVYDEKNYQIKTARGQNV